MELIQAIALLCQVSFTCGQFTNDCKKLTIQTQVDCQQSYLNCVLKRSTMSQTEALQKCILEK
jgi:hypothetical protein